MSIESVIYSDNDITFFITTPDDGSGDRGQISVDIGGDDFKDKSHILYDIEYKKTNHNLGYSGLVEYFYILDTNVKIRIVKDSLLLDIYSNGLTNYFFIKNETVYDKIMDTIHSAIKAIKHKRLNTVNVPHFPVHASAMNTVGSFLSGENGTIAQQRLKIGPANGGRRKTRKARKAYKK